MSEDEAVHRWDADLIDARVGDAAPCRACAFREERDFRPQCVAGYVGQVVVRDGVAQLACSRIIVGRCAVGALEVDRRVRHAVRIDREDAAVIEVLLQLGVERCPCWADL